jgi:alpha-ketoglutarate-dependent taurine dioxygenase
MKRPMSDSITNLRSSATTTPFDPADDRAYRSWREWKLSGYPRRAEDLIVSVADPIRISAAERQALLSRCQKANAAIYRITAGDIADKELVSSLGRQFGLVRLDRNLRADEDSITSLKVVPGTDGAHYIPYTNRPLNWHTDGYYNTPDEQVRGVVMHCVSDAAEGGGNVYLDHEMAYLLLRDENPDYLRALMQPDAMTIPANIEAGVEIRPAQTGPVFSVEPHSGSLHMRYTARTRSIAWKDDSTTRRAVGFLSELLAGESAFLFRHRLRPGEGIICNNILHQREAFADDPGNGRTRLLYRARYYDRIRGTELNTIWSGVRPCSG